VTFSLDSSVRPSDHAVFREVDDDAVVLDATTGHYFGLDPVGKRVWQLIDQLGDLRAVHDALVREFEVSSDEARRDLLALVAELSDKGLVTSR
jgi:hypothetical protein